MCGLGLVRGVHGWFRVGLGDSCVVWGRPGGHVWFGVGRGVMCGLG